jgi:hypothetical protein
VFSIVFAALSRCFADVFTVFATSSGRFATFPPRFHAFLDVVAAFLDVDDPLTVLQERVDAVLLEYEALEVEVDDV